MKLFMFPDGLWEEGLALGRWQLKHYEGRWSWKKRGLRELAMGAQGELVMAHVLGGERRGGDQEEDVFIPGWGYVEVRTCSQLWHRLILEPDSFPSLPMCHLVGEWPEDPENTDVPFRPSTILWKGWVRPQDAVYTRKTISDNSVRVVEQRDLNPPQTLLDLIAVAPQLARTSS